MFNQMFNQTKRRMLEHCSVPLMQIEEGNMICPDRIVDVKMFNDITHTRILEPGWGCDVIPAKKTNYMIMLTMCNEHYRGKCIGSTGLNSLLVYSDNKSRLQAYRYMKGETSSSLRSWQTWFKGIPLAVGERSIILRDYQIHTSDTHDLASTKDDPVHWLTEEEANER